MTERDPLSTPAVAGGLPFDATQIQFIQAGAGAISRTLRDKDRDIVSVKDFGAVGDGVTDDGAAIALAVTYCKTLSCPELVFPAGVYYIGTTLLSLDLPDYSSIRFVGRITSAATGTAVRIGSTSTDTFGYYIAGLDVRRTVIDPAKASIGIDIRNIHASHISHRYTTGFGFGIYFNGTNFGNSYNQVHLGWVYDNNYNLFLTAAGANGYCNENEFFGGGFGFSSSWNAAFGNYTGTYDIYEDDASATHALNGNKFFGPGLESGGTATVAAQIYGQSTYIISPRIEAGSGTPTDFKIVFGAASRNCVLMGASGLVLANITDNGTSNSYICKDGQVWRNDAGTGTAIHSSRAQAGDGTVRAYEARDTSNIAQAWMQVNGVIVGKALRTSNTNTQTGATYAVLATDTSIIANRAGTVTLTLESASVALGKLLLVRTIQAQTVVSDASNVVPLVGGAAGTAILAATAGKWALLQSDGTNWQIMAGN